MFFLSVESMREQLNLIIGVGFIPVMGKAFPRENDEMSKERRFEDNNSAF